MNPKGKIVGDCVIRGIAKFLRQTWDETFIDLAAQGLEEKDVISSNAVWGNYLRKNHYRRKSVPDDCPNCMTVRDFCERFPNGRFLVASGDHVVPVIDGCYYDTFDSGDEPAIFYWY